MKQLKFTKMQGLGNDFIVLNGLNQRINLTAQQIASLADRHRGIGFDQCLIIEPSSKAGVDFNYRIFNSNGQEVGQCGNGARCLALFVRHYGLSTKNQFTVSTKTTQMNLLIHQDNTVTVDMGQPRLEPQNIPLLADKQEDLYALNLKNGQKILIHAINVGNPHAVIPIDDLRALQIDKLGQEISTHKHFPEQANASFMRIISPGHIQLRVFERGCGETQACGSAAVAAAAIGRLYHHLEAQIKVSLLGGDLRVDWPDLNGAIRLTGPAHFVYEGIVNRTC